MKPVEQELLKRGYRYHQDIHEYVKYVGGHAIEIAGDDGRGWVAFVDGNQVNTRPLQLALAYDLAERRVEALNEENMDDEKPILLMALLTLSVLILTAWYVLYAQ